MLLRPKSSARKALAICLVPCIVAIAGPIAKGSARSTPVLGPATSPRAFKDDLKARLVSADHLWMFVTGKVDGPQTNELRAFARIGQRWSRDQALTATIDPDENIAGGTIRAGAASRRHPCIGFTDSSLQPVLTCRTGGGWNDLVGSNRLSRFGSLADVRTAGNGLLVLFSVASGAHQIMRVIRIAPSGRVSHVGRPIKTKRAIAFLGLAGAPSILAQDLRSDRYVLGFRKNRWQRITDKLHGEEGPLVSGAATVGWRHIIPVSNADRSPWTFSVFSFGRNGWRGTKLSRGTGDAQGNLSQTGKTVWAVWQESDYQRGSFSTRIKISRSQGRRGNFSPAATVFAGLSPGPGDLQVARWHGKDFVLYLAPRVRGGRTLKAFVRPVR